MAKPEPKSKLDPPTPHPDSVSLTMKAMIVWLAMSETVAPYFISR